MKNLSRREFLQCTGTLLSASMISPSFGVKKSFKIGLQLYSIRDAMATDPKGTLKRVADFGYEEVEIYGFNNRQYYGFDPKTFRRILEDNNLSSPSGHYDLNSLMPAVKTDDDRKRYVDACIEGALAIGQKYIVWPWLNPEFRNYDGFKKVSQLLSVIGEQTRNAGLGLLYHNHDFEFVDLNGTNGYEIILTETEASLVKLQMDLYWIAHSSKMKPREFFKRYPGRFVSWHLKDMNKANRDLHDVMGEGSINFRKILLDTDLAGAEHLIVEQGNNYVPDAMENVARSARYVKNVLLK
jgi:sugar phosphate isomerase/epimerase